MASSTPGVLRRNRSIRLTHEAQVMPSIGRAISAVDGWWRLGSTYSLGVYQARRTPGPWIGRPAHWSSARARGHPRHRPNHRRAVGPAPYRRDDAWHRGRGVGLRPTTRSRTTVARRVHGSVAPEAAAPPDDPRRAHLDRRRGGHRAISSPAARLAPTCHRSTSPTDRTGIAACSARSGRSPWGETASYGEIARRIGAPGAARAVGGALGRNPISLIVPCHRVIAADGTIGGYGGDAWGSREAALDRKRALLRREGVTVRVGDRERD